MLFDLKGKRRRTVQVTYVFLAGLMAIGLIGAGVGSGVSGGLFDLFGGGGGGSTANKTVENRIKKAEKTLRVNPRDQVALAILARSHYALASADVDRKTNAFGKDGKKELALASSAWERFLATNPKKPDASLAAVMLVAYSKNGLNRPSDAARAAEILAAENDNASAYIRLTACATIAGQTRKATLAGQRAIELAKDQKKAAKQEVAAAKSPQTAPQYCAG
jgi:hypothetical protein